MAKIVYSIVPRQVDVVVDVVVFVLVVVVVVRPDDVERQLKTESPGNCFRF